MRHRIQHFEPRADLVPTQFRVGRQQISVLAASRRFFPPTAQRLSCSVAAIVRGMPIKIGKLSGRGGRPREGYLEMLDRQAVPNDRRHTMSRNTGRQLTIHMFDYTMD